MGDEFETEVVENVTEEAVEVPEVEVEVTEETDELVETKPSKLDFSGVQDSLTGAAITIVSGVVVKLAIEATTKQVRKGYRFAKKRIGGYFENRKEQKLLKALEAEEAAQKAQEENESENE